MKQVAQGDLSLLKHPSAQVLLRVEDSGSSRLRGEGRNAACGSDLVSLEWTRYRDGEPAEGSEVEVIGFQSEGVADDR